MPYTSLKSLKPFTNVTKSITSFCQKECDQGETKGKKTNFEWTNKNCWNADRKMKDLWRYYLVLVTYHIGLMKECKKVFTWDSWWNTPEKFLFTLLSIAGEMIYFFAGGMVGMKRPIEKCKQTRAISRGKNVAGNNTGIYWITFALN